MKTKWTESAGGQRLSIDLFILSSADDSVESVESSRSNKQDVCCVHLNRLSSQFPGVFLRNIDDCALQEFKQTLAERKRE